MTAKIFAEGDVQPTSIRLSEEADRKLEFLSRGTGHSKSYFLKEIIEKNIDTIIEEYRLDALVKNHEQGKSSVYAEAEMDAEFGKG